MQSKKMQNTQDIREQPLKAINNKNGGISMKSKIKGKIYELRSKVEEAEGMFMSELIDTIKQKQKEYGKKQSLIAKLW